MPKRKREDADHDGPRSSKSLSSSAGAYFTQSLKLLHRALKTSKGFERQKLGKRLTNAKTKNLLADCTRINQEISVLKELDLNKVGESHLKKSLGKVKLFAECEGLKDVLGGDLWKPEGNEDVQKAYRNVVSGMCNMKQVKEVVEGAVSGMYGVLEIKRPDNAKESKKKKAGAEARGGEKAKIAEAVADDEDDADTEESVADDHEEMSWEGFSDDRPNGGNANDELNGIDQDEEDVEYQPLEDDEIERFESLLGDPSEDEASSEEDIWSKIRASIAKDPKIPKAHSLSPEPAEHDIPPSESQASDSEIEPPPPVKIKKAKTPKVASQPPPVKSSTFLPTLMGGYWSGTESSASDLEDNPLTSIKEQRKNRPGQAARRALWEKKYKDKANHITAGQGSLAEQRQAVLESRGVVSKKRGRDGRGERSGHGRGAGLSGGNAISVGQRRNGRREAPKKDDSGPLHPSWQAAKAAKTLEKTAKFEGKKVVF